ncbi:hypothetical protein CSKR_107910 [Clonorchis sinensis]|uniref:Uncharacterized protein n=1 Tax=Clonorchis sinensis TaxID=79923 RepID=A0A3R7FPZ2_CLOSI|nr:hypothetical protein CSKR_107910 [Clonorchis sinensis]
MKSTSVPRCVLRAMDDFNKKSLSCSTLSVPSCHATRRKHEGWDTASLPQPRQRLLLCPVITVIDSKTSVFNTDVVLPYNHKSLYSLTINNKSGWSMNPVPACHNHSEGLTPPDTHSGNLDKNR